MSKLNSDLIKNSLLPELSQITITCFDTTDSTNTQAKALARQGAEHFSLVVANEQTAGKGRLGRTFYSPADSGIYLSLILRPQFDITDATIITTACSVAVAMAIKKVCGIKVQIKWVNDLLFNGKKVCGILTESESTNGKLSFIVLGIGINFTMSQFPCDIQNKAGAIFASTDITREALIAQILNEFYAIYRKLPSHEFMEFYRQNNCTLGKQITVLVPGGSYKAQAKGITDEGGLVVSLQNGETQIISSGEVAVEGLY